MPKIQSLEDRPRQFNFQTTRRQRSLLLYYAEVTKSIATAGPTKGQISIGALIRRISDGELQIVDRGKVIQIPITHTFDIQKEE